MELKTPGVYHFLWYLLCLVLCTYTAGLCPAILGLRPPQGAPPVMHNKKELQEDWLGPPGVSHARPITGHRLEAGSCSICDPDTSIAYGPTRL